MTTINAKRDDNFVPAILGHSSTGPTASAWPVVVSNLGELHSITQIHDGANLGAFGRLRTAQPVGVFDSTFQYDMQPNLYYRTGASGATATHVPNLSSTQLTLNGTTGGYMQLQSKAYHRYIPAKSQLIVMTFVFGAAVPNLVRRVGYFDNNDGIFLEQNGTTDVAFTQRTSTSGSPSDAARVTQANWNLDKLDGTGPSGITLDLSKSQILFMDLQWLGMGRVRVGFDIDGLIVYVHQFLNANNLAVPYMKTANLPVRWEISTAGTATGSMYATCASVISEGGNELDRGFPFSIANIATGVNSATGIRSPVLSIQPTGTFNGITNRIQVALDEFEIINNGSNPVYAELVYNTTVSGGSWTAVDSNSSVQYNTSVTATGVTGGTCIASALIVGTNQQKAGEINTLPSARLPITVDPAGANPITVTLYAQGIGGNSTVNGSVSWRELR